MIINQKNSIKLFVILQSYMDIIVENYALYYNSRHIRVAYVKKNAGH